MRIAYALAVVLTALALVPGGAHVAELPANWEELRTHWEFGHVAAAALMFAALCSVALAAGGGQRDRR